MLDPFGFHLHLRIRVVPAVAPKRVVDRVDVVLRAGRVEVPDRLDETQLGKRAALILVGGPLAGKLAVSRA